VQTKDCSLADLHELIQVSMGWHGGHLHLFEIGGEWFGLPEQWDEDFGEFDDVLNTTAHGCFPIYSGSTS
jgi:hypothetical protein